MWIKAFRFQLGGWSGYKNIKKQANFWCQSGNTMVRVSDLYSANPNFIYSKQYGPPSPPVVIPKHGIRNKSWAFNDSNLKIDKKLNKNIISVHDNWYIQNIFIKYFYISIMDFFKSCAIFYLLFNS